MNMKHALCSLVLLIATSTAGLLVEPKDASAASVTIADRWEEIHNSDWKGSWEAGPYAARGRAKLHLVRMGNTSYVRAKIWIYGGYSGNNWYRISGTTSGNMIQLRKESNETVFFLSEEDGKLVLRGNYEVLTGQYAGETGTYYFEKVD